MFNKFVFGNVTALQPRILRAAPQTVQTASPVCGTKNFSSVRLYSAPQLHCTIVAIQANMRFGSSIFQPGSYALFHEPPARPPARVMLARRWSAFRLIARMGRLRRVRYVPPQPNSSARQVRTFRDLFLIAELLDFVAESDDVGLKRNWLGCPVRSSGLSGLLKPSKKAGLSIKPKLD